MRSHTLKVFFIVLSAWMVSGLLGATEALAQNHSQGSTCGPSLGVKTLPSEVAEDVATPIAAQAAKRLIGKVVLRQTKDGVQARLNSDWIPSAKKSNSITEEFMEKLAPHLDVSSITSLRVEEKAVVDSEGLKKFHEVTRSHTLEAQGFSGFQWKMRDVPQSGTVNKAMTVYGQSLEYGYSGAGSRIIVKPRLRKYFRSKFENAGNLAAAKTSIGDSVIMELKITTFESGDIAKPFGIRGTTFKPRIAINDAIAEEFQDLYGAGVDFKSHLNDLKLKVLALDDDLSKNVNTPEKVESFFLILAKLYKEQPFLFKPYLMTSYTRSSFHGLSLHGKFQFTVDSDIKVARPGSTVNMKKLPKEFAGRILFESDADQNFIELKSPVEMKANRSALYRYLKNALVADHNPDFELDGGKYSVGRRMSLVSSGSKVDNELYEQGTLFWMIKGTAYLPKPPKKNDITERGSFSFARPFIGRDGKEYRLILTYRQLNALGDESPAVLDKIELVNASGREIKVPGDKVNLENAVDYSKVDQTLSLLVDGTLIPFKGKISAQDRRAYLKFFKKYYYAPGKGEGIPRAVEDLQDLKSAKQLIFERVKVKVGNAGAYVKERGQRALVTAILISSVAYFAQDGGIARLSNAINERISGGDHAVYVIEEDSGNINTVLEPYKTLDGKVIPLFTETLPNGKVLYRTPFQYQEYLESNADGEILLYTPTGIVLIFEVTENSDGTKNLMEKEK